MREFDVATDTVADSETLSYDCSFRQAGEILIV